MNLTVPSIITFVLGSAMSLSVCAAGVQSEPEEGATDSKKGEFSIDARAFYFDRRFDLPDTSPARALTGGGIAKYETAAVNHFKAAAGFYGSFSLFGIIDRELAVGTALLQPDTDDIAFIGEAYLDYDTGENQFKAGRQRLATPLINDRDFRMLPSVFEAAVYRNRSFPDTLLEAGYVYSESGFGSTLNGFGQQIDLWGKNGLGYFYASTKYKGIALRAQFSEMLENSGRYQNISYTDVNIPISKGLGTHLQAQAGGTAYQLEDNANMAGLKVSSRFSALTLSAVYNRIRGNIFSAVEAGPLYTDWQQGYGNYEPSDALGVHIIYEINDGFKLSAGYVDVESVEGDAFNLDSYAESVFDVFYWFDQKSHVRLRYSDKKQSADSDIESRQDFRIIFYYDLS